MQNKHRILIFLIVSIVLPMTAELITKTIGAELFGQEWIGLIIFIVVGVLIALAIDGIIRLIEQKKKAKISTSIVGIKKIGKRYRVPISDSEFKPMFDVPEKEEDLAATLNGKYRPIIYYSLSAKEYLNWIDYSYFCFMRDVKNALNCEVIVALHYNDKLRATNLTRETDLDSYKTICETYSGWVKKIIGDDVKILTEDEFYKKNPYDYAVDFHNIYVNKILEYVKLMDSSTPDDQRLDFEQFKRKLSYVESVFPIKEISSKYKKDKKVFVLDRVSFQEIWHNDETLNLIKKNNNIIFISATTLTYPDGKSINVHKKENVPNFTDSEFVLKKKIDGLDMYTTKMMYSILSTNVNQPMHAFVFPTDEVLAKNALFELFRDINAQYSFDRQEVL